MKSFDLILVSKFKALQDRVADISTELGYTFEKLASVDEFCEREAEFKEPGLIVVSAEDVEVESEIAGRVQVVRQMAPGAFLLEPEVEYSSKLEFIFSQKIKSSYIPIKANELKIGTQLKFALYHQYTMGSTL